MRDQIAADEDADMRFARRLHQACLVRFGDHHELTRVVARYISELEDGDSSRPRRLPVVSAKEATFVPVLE